MPYPKAQVRTALAEARKAGRVTDGMTPDLRDTELQLERWGFLPLQGDDATDKRVADWYRSQGLVMVEDARPDAPPRAGEPPSDAALLAAEAALAAAQAALALARSMRPA